MCSFQNHSVQSQPRILPRKAKDGPNRGFVYPNTTWRRPQVSTTGLDLAIAKPSPPEIGSPIPCRPPPKRLSIGAWDGSRAGLWSAPLHRHPTPAPRISRRRGLFVIWQKETQNRAGNRKKHQDLEDGRQTDGVCQRAEKCRSDASRADSETNGQSGSQ